MAVSLGTLSASFRQPDVVETAASSAPCRSAAADRPVNFGGVRLRLQFPQRDKAPRQPARFDSIFDGISLAPRENLAAALVKLRECRETQDRASALLAVADARLANEDVPQALEDVAEAASALRQEGDLEGETVGLLVLSKAHLASGDATRAESLANEAVVAFQSSGHKVGEAAASNIAAQACLKRDPEQALRLAIQSQELLNSAGDTRRVAMVQRTIMGAHLARGCPMDALAVARRLLDSCREFADRRGEGATCVLVAECYAGVGNSEEALHWYHEATELFRGLADGHNEAAAMFMIARLRLERGEKRDADQAAAVASSAQSIFRDAGDVDKTFLLGAVLRSALLAQSKRTEAFDSARDDLMRAEESGSKPRVAACLHELATMHLSCAEPKEARRVANEARAIYQELGDWRQETSILSGIAASHFMDRVPESGLQAAADALAIFRKHGERRGEGALLLDIGALQFDRRMPSKALRALASALSIFHGLGDAMSTRKCETLISQAQKMKSELKTACASARTAMTRFREEGNPDGLWESARILYEARTKFGPSPNGPITGPIKLPASEGTGGASDPSDPSPKAVLHQPFGCDWSPKAASCQVSPACQRHLGLWHDLRRAGEVIWKPPT